MPPGDIWQCLVTLVFVPPEKEEVNTGISRVEANDAAKHPTMHRTVPPIMKYWMPVVPRLRNPISKGQVRLTSFLPRYA